MKKLVSIFLSLFFSFAAFTQDISGKWSGMIETGQTEKVYFNFNFVKAGNNYTTDIEIPARKITGLKPKETHIANGTLLVNGANLGFKYEGKLIQNYQQIDGTFIEGEYTFRLVLERSEAKMESTAK